MTDRRKLNGARAPTVSIATAQGEVLELVYDREREATALVLWDGASWKTSEKVKLGGREFVPLAPTNNLISQGVVLLPSTPSEYDTDEELISEIRSFLRRYVSVSSRFEEIAIYYILLTWLYDRFNELPYLRLRGDYGSGKTRFLLTVGSLCYRPIFASGASTVAPIFHTLNAFRGTLIIDEADFRATDERADIVKILNNGNVRGLRVLRMQVNAKGEYSPRSYDVFGPKIVASRSFYEDRALESRFITEEMQGRSIRRDIPINLDGSYEQEALELRNKLLTFRFRNWAGTSPKGVRMSAQIEPRLQQIFGPLLAIIKEPELRDQVSELAVEYQEDAIAERGLQIEAHVLEALRDLFRETSSASVPIGAIAEALARRNDPELGRHMSNRWMGTFLRRNLRIRTQKSHGVFVVPFTEKPRIETLCERYGLVDRP